MLDFPFSFSPSLFCLFFFIFGACWYYAYTLSHPSSVFSPLTPSSSSSLLPPLSLSFSHTILTIDPHRLRHPSKKDPDYLSISPSLKGITYPLAGFLFYRYEKFMNGVSRSSISLSIFLFLNSLFFAYFSFCHLVSRASHLVPFL